MSLLWLVPILPVVGFVVLTLFGRRIGRASGVVGVASVGLSALVTMWVGYNYLTSPPLSGAFHEVMWSWFSVGALHIQAGLYLDSFSLLMILVITFVAFFIHLYSIGYMADDAGYARYFAYMNLFVASMLILVLASNLVFFFLGWEGVGMCSYLLIGFWYKDPANARAAVKAFVVTRVGDAAMMIGLLLLYVNLGTLDIQQILTRAQAEWAQGSPVAIAAAALILGGAVGKSAQLPLQTWLPDAMAGPTPVSALIHAATMVTAGVYLIARTHTLFTLAPAVQLAVAVVGAGTLVIAGFASITQWDIKRVLAYSTMSQIGYMFLALGVGAWPAGIYHFMTHAFFKSLLFLGAGAVIVYMRHEQDLFKMGGLAKRIPVVFWTFLIGCLAMSAVPPLISGFSSKDWILYWVWASPQGGPVLWVLGIVGVFLTSTYTFRLVFLAFFGSARGTAAGHEASSEQSHGAASVEGATSPAEHDHAGAQGEAGAPSAGAPLGAIYYIPLVVLAAGALLLGLLQTPRGLLGINLFSTFIATSLPGATPATPGATELILESISELLALAGIAFAYLLARSQARAYVEGRVGRQQLLHRFWFSGWGFDWVYDRLLTRPYLWLARVNQGDVVDWIARGATAITRGAYTSLRVSQSGKLRWYAALLGAGAVAILAVVVFL